MTEHSALLADLARRTSPHGKVMAVSMMKDEAPYLLEWIAHHLAVGFTDILVYTNDCSDGTVEMLKRLEELGLAVHRENVIPEGHKPQPSALNHAQAEPLVQGADWVLVFDADEFLVISHPSGSLDGMIADAVAQGANGIVITWRIFGSGGVVDWSRAPVSEQYLRAAPPLWNKGWGVKTLFKFDPDYWKLGIHRPSIKNKWLETDFPAQVRWLNGSGKPMEEYFKFRGWRSIRRTLGYDWAQINHYAVKSVDAYAIRKFRGNVNNKKDKYNADYWALQDRCEVEDRQILHHAPMRAKIMAALLSDPILAGLHEAALTRLEARLAEYKATEAYAQLRDSLIAASKIPITQVEAKPPQARDPAKIAALMSRVEKKVAETPKEARRTPNVAGWAGSDGSPYTASGQGAIDPALPLDWVANHAVLLPADPRVLTPEGVEAVLAGRFERRHARNIAAYAAGAQRLADLGAGIGFLAVKLLREVAGLVVLAQENRAPLAAVMRMVAAQNGLSDTARLKITEGPLILEGDGQGQAGGLAAILRDFRPDTLRLSPWSDGLTLTGDDLAQCDLGMVARVILPFNSDARAAELRAEFGPALGAQGLVEREDRANAGSLLFLRG